MKLYWAIAAALLPVFPALADDRTIAESALREARDIISRDLFGHYDVSELQVVKVDGSKVTLRFSAARNATRSPSLNPAMFEPGSPMCQDWLYLHCGVPNGHVFEGKLEVTLDGSGRAVSPRPNSRSRYSLDGYLLLEGREKEGYVLFPKRGKQ